MNVRLIIRFFLISFLFFFSFPCLSMETVKVGIAVGAKDAVFIAASSDYSLLNSESQILDTIHEGESVQFTFVAASVELKLLDGKRLKGKRFYLRSVSPTAFFRFLSSGTAYPYDDELQVSAISNGLTAVNLVRMEKYVSGVVESEAGDNLNPEFLKVQCMLVRTFVESHSDRHSAQGFMVCDKVHCQVYHARSRFNKQIVQAIEATMGKVIVEGSGKIITAVYHSNCGGQTMDANDLWSKPLSYLKSVKDSFCIRSGHRKWEKTIDRMAWKQYLGKKFNCIIYDDIPDSAFTFNQQVRKNYLLFDGNLLALKTIRNDWKLNSTFFNIIPMGDKIFIRGKGYGHGVGLCQEGAMQMAEAGYKMEDIIAYYFGGASTRSITDKP